MILDNTDITNSQNGYWYLAVSLDSNPSDGFNIYNYLTPGDFPDQPPLGFNDDKIVTGGNSFSCISSSTDPGDPNCSNGDYEGNEFLVWSKSELLAAPASDVVNNTAIDTDLFTPGPPGQDESNLPIIPAKSRSTSPTQTLWMIDTCVLETSACTNSVNIWAIVGAPGATPVEALTTAVTVNADHVAAGRAAAGYLEEQESESDRHR